jgi:hypothetical protein
MNSLIKKLKSCRFSKASDPPRRDEPFHDTRHHCDHPQMKIDWRIEKCGDCKVYEPISKPAPVHSSKH